MNTAAYTLVLVGAGVLAVVDVMGRTRDLRGSPLRWIAGTRGQGLSALLGAELVVLGILVVAVKTNSAWPCLLTLPVFAASSWWLGTVDRRGQDLDVPGPYEPHEPSSNVRPRE